MNAFDLLLVIALIFFALCIGFCLGWLHHHRALEQRLRELGELYERISSGHS